MQESNIQRLCTNMLCALGKKLNLSGPCIQDSSRRSSCFFKDLLLLLTFLISETPPSTQYPEPEHRSSFHLILPHPVDRPLLSCQLSCNFFRHVTSFGPYLTVISCLVMTIKLLLLPLLPVVLSRPSLSLPPR